MSGNAGKNYSSSTLTLTFTEDTHLSFEYKVSSEAKYDKCTITLGSTTLVDGVSGDQEWKGLELDAKRGDKLTVLYKKDSSGDKFDDCVYLRNFSAGEALVVTFHANNGTEDTATQKIFGGKGTLKANTFTCEGKIFAGWATSAGGAVVYEDGAAITTETDLDLYAVWSDAYTVTLRNGDTDTTVLVPQNSAIGSRIPADPTKKGYTFEGKTYEELAEQIGVDGAALAETMNTWNGYVEAKNDPDFGRTSFADKLDTAPYYAIKVTAGVHHTMGGLKINTNTEVLNENGEIIPGLFAAGEVTGGVHGANRLGGTAVSDFVVFGRIAGAAASKYAA